MTRSSSAGADSVGRFLRNQRFRHQETRRIYGHILRAFQSSVSECSTSTSVSVSNLQEWLREKRQLWPLPHGLPSSSTCGAIPGMVAGPWRDLHESVC
jgi:hypothetical protein